MGTPATSADLMVESMSLRRIWMSRCVQCKPVPTAPRTHATPPKDEAIQQMTEKERSRHRSFLSSTFDLLVNRSEHACNAHAADYTGV